MFIYVHISTQHRSIWQYCSNIVNIATMLLQILCCIGSNTRYISRTQYISCPITLNYNNISGNEKWNFDLKVPNFGSNHYLQLKLINQIAPSRNTSTLYQRVPRSYCTFFRLQFYYNFLYWLIWSINFNH